MLYCHPAVQMCAVIGVPDDQWGEVGVACVVLQPDATVTEEAIRDYLMSNLARFKAPKRVQFLDGLPLSSMGKILKRELRDQFSGETQPPWYAVS